MARPFSFILLAAFLILALPVTWGQVVRQSSHHRMESRTAPDDFDRIEKQEEAERQAQLAKKNAVGQQRQAQLTELAGELPRLRTLCQELQERLNSTDLKNSLPVELRKQSAELERLARQINKQVRGL